MTIQTILVIGAAALVVIAIVGGIIVLEENRRIYTPIEREPWPDDGIRHDDDIMNDGIEN